MPDVEFIPASQVVFTHRTAAPPSEASEAEVAESWRRAVECNPSLFNGSLVSPIQVDIREDVCRVSWCHSDFAHYHYSRQTRDQTRSALMGTVFVSVVIPTGDGRLVVGRMADHTSSPGIVQLPGGGLSPGTARPLIAMEDLLATAVQEAREELGLTLSPASLRISGVIRRRSPFDLGVVFMAAPHAWDDVVAAFSRLQAISWRAGVRPEFDQLLRMGPGGPNRAGPAGVRVIDYLPEVLDAFCGIPETPTDHRSLD